jgi:hypothetical protein
MNHDCSLVRQLMFLHEVSQLTVAAAADRVHIESSMLTAYFSGDGVLGAGTIIELCRVYRAEFASITGTVHDTEPLEQPEPRPRIRRPAKPKPSTPESRERNRVRIRVWRERVKRSKDVSDVAASA